MEAPDKRHAHARSGSADSPRAGAGRRGARSPRSDPVHPRAPPSSTKRYARALGF
jgi:hypothetical protein